MKSPSHRRAEGGCPAGRLGLRSVVEVRGDGRRVRRTGPVIRAVEVDADMVRARIIEGRIVPSVELDGDTGL